MALALFVRQPVNPRGDSLPVSGLVLSVGRSTVTRFSRGTDVAQVRLPSGQVVYAAVSSGVVVRRGSEVSLREYPRGTARSEYQVVGVVGR